MPSYPAWGAPFIARGLLYIRGKHEIICYDISEAAVDEKDDSASEASGFDESS